ncbi:MAG: hypothetical protein KR126chlam1_00691 [Chlamydiae bacterium]|nr:hypothetical protein [Chlamydiota bacterium]
MSGITAVHSLSSSPSQLDMIAKDPPSSLMKFFAIRSIVVLASAGVIALTGLLSPQTALISMTALYLLFSLPLIGGYSLMERAFRTTVFQYAVYPVGWVERGLIAFYRSGKKKTCCPPPIDPVRMERSLGILKTLGGKEAFVIPEDGNAKIHMMTLKAEDLEERIIERGGTWEKRENCFVIIPPEDGSLEWKEFEANCLLNKTGWKKESIDGKEVIVTSKNADLVKQHQYWALHSHSAGFPFVQERERIGFWLGMKQNICLYDQRGIWKSDGIASEKGHYLDIEAVYKQLVSEQGPRPSEVVLTGSCGGVLLAAHLKRLHHEEGIHIISEKSFVDLVKEMIDPQHFLPRWIAKWNLDAIKSRDIPQSIGPEEDNFSIENKWKGLPFSVEGKVIIVQARNDQTLSKGAEHRLEALARKVNKEVSLLYFSPPVGIDGHNGFCLRDSAFHRPLVESIFA